MRLERPSTYACYYGSHRLSDLAAFDLVILQPSHYSPEDIHILQCQNTFPVAYLAIGEEPATQTPTKWALLNPETGLVVCNPNWQTTFVDCRSLAWHTHLIQERIPDIVAHGYMGLFLDTLDVADRYPETQSGVIRLVRLIRTVYPHLVLIVNRGFSILNEIIDLLDAFLFESFTTHYVAGDYVMWDDVSLTWTAQQAAMLHAMGGQIPLLALDYADPTDYTLRQLAWQRACTHGFLPYVTTRALDWLPKSDPVVGGSESYLIG